MAIHLSARALDALNLAHAAFVGRAGQATYDRIVRTLAELDIAPGLFALTDACEQLRPGLPAHLKAYQVIHEVEPSGPNVSIVFLLSAEDEDVTVTSIAWG